MHELTVNRTIEQGAFVVPARCRTFAIIWLPRACTSAKGRRPARVRSNGWWNAPGLTQAPAPRGGREHEENSPAEVK